MFSKRDQFCSFWDQFCRFAYLIRLGDHFCAGITFAAVQGNLFNGVKLNQRLTLLASNALKEVKHLVLLFNFKYLKCLVDDLVSDH